MKYLKLLFCLCIPLFVLSGCEQSTNLRTAVIRDISVSGSGTYGVGVSFLEDKRLEKKSVDVQVKSDKAETVEIWEENQNKYSYKFENANTWVSITTIFVNVKDSPDTEDFEEYTQASARRYLFSSEKDVKLTFRVVAGEEKDNASKKGKILTGSEQISDEFNLDIKAKKQ